MVGGQTLDIGKWQIANSWARILCTLRVVEEVLRSRSLGMGSGFGTGYRLQVTGDRRTTNENSSDIVIRWVADLVLDARRGVI